MMPSQLVGRHDDPVVQLDELARTFPGPPPVAALKPCTLTLHRGEYVAITGQSGSGKTTLLSLLGLLDVPTSGRYLLEGNDVATLNDRDRSAIRARQVGFVFQSFHLVGYRSVLDNVELGLVYQGIPARQRRQRATEVVDHVGLSHRRHATCATLSGGEKQRVAIARTLIRQPSLVLCDEPTGNLDTATSRQILELLDGLHSAGMTIVVITHDHDVASRAKRRLSISDGVLTDHRTTDA